MTDSLVDHGLPPLQPHKGQPSCLFLGLRLPLSITEIFGLERRLEHPYVLFQNNSQCEIKVIEEKQHVKYPVQYVLRSLRRTKGIMIVNKGDRVSPYTLQKKRKNIYSKLNRRKQVKGQETGKEKKRIQYTTAGGIEEVKQVNV